MNKINLLLLLWPLFQTNILLAQEEVDMFARKATIKKEGEIFYPKVDEDVARRKEKVVNQLNGEENNAPVLTREEHTKKRKLEETEKNQKIQDPQKIINDLYSDAETVPEAEMLNDIIEDEDDSEFYSIGFRLHINFPQGPLLSIDQKLFEFVSLELGAGSMQDITIQNVTAGDYVFDEMTFSKTSVFGGLKVHPFFGSLFLSARTGTEAISIDASASTFDLGNDDTIVNTSLTRSFMSYGLGLELEADYLTIGFELGMISHGDVEIEQLIFVESNKKIENEKITETINEYASKSMPYITLLKIGVIF